MLSLTPSHRGVGQLVAVATPAKGFDIYNISTGQPLGTVNARRIPNSALSPPQPYHPNPVLFVHDGLALLGGSNGGHVHLWDIETKRIIQILRHPGEIACVAVISWCL